MLKRRGFLECTVSGLGLAVLGRSPLCAHEDQERRILATGAETGIFEYLKRHSNGSSEELYQRILGAANEFKEGDEIVGVAAADEQSRVNARALLSRTTIRQLDTRPVHADQMHAFLANSVLDSPALGKWTIGELKSFLLTKSEGEIKEIVPSLSSQTIGCVVKLMSNQELIGVASKIFNPLPGSQVGSKGYLGARVQPNSPTDNLDDIRWQVFDAWAYAVGDVLLGTNPVSSDPRSVASVERTLKELLTTFKLERLMPHCVLSHIDVQAQVEEQQPGSTALWFQSIAGTDGANKTFDVSVKKLVDYAKRRNGKYGLYFETGQGADFTNGHGQGFDMVLHEARKYGLARALAQEVRRSQDKGLPGPWVHVNDVAGFIGPEVFRSREQLVRCCLEDIVMGKLHGLCIGLDICSTLHMDVSLDDLDWCIDQIMPANPAYLMALPTKIDPMLGYLTTSYQDHVRIREKFGYRVDDQVWKFFRDELRVVDRHGQPTEHFGDPVWVYLCYCRKRGDKRTTEEIAAEGRQHLSEIRGRGVFIAEGYGDRPGQLAPQLAKDIQRIYKDAKQSIWARLSNEFIRTIPNALPIETQSKDRNDYILHPESGENLQPRSSTRLQQMRADHAGQFDVQIVVSDGLNALAIMDEGHLLPYLRKVRELLVAAGHRVSKEHIVLRSGRVRAGYRIGETLFADQTGDRLLLHIIGERPGTGHHTFSVYITNADGRTWGKVGTVDHNITKVVSGAAVTALSPLRAADETMRIVRSLM